jgi:hypothetical protein
MDKLWTTGRRIQFKEWKIMAATDFKLVKLERALECAARLSSAHAEAVKAAEKVFEQTFGEDVPEESFKMTGGTNKNEVGHLFNEMVNHDENMGGDSLHALVLKMKKLMESGE